MSGRTPICLLLCSGLLRAATAACSPPADTPLCQFPARIRIAFVGTVIQVIHNPGPNAVEISTDSYRVAVNEPLSGLRSDETELLIRQSLNGGTPEAGRHFLIQAERRGNRIYLASCGQTKPAEDAAEEIKYLRERLRGTFRPYIAGSILRNYTGSEYSQRLYRGSLHRGLANARLTLRSPMGSINLVTDAEGRFRKNSVAPGRYSVTVQSPGYQLSRAYSIEVPEHGCGIAHIGMFTNAGISGTVRHADGSPAKNTPLDLIDADPAYESPHLEAYPLQTGPNGEFAVSNLPGGRFILGFAIAESSHYPDRTPPTYFPGGAARSDAAVIELKPNELKSGLNLTLLPAREFRTARVHLRYPDGSIPKRGAIDAYRGKGIYVTNYDFRNGTFELKLLRGVDYWLNAGVIDQRDKSSWAYADSYHVPPGNDAFEITLTARFPEPQWPKF